MPDGQVWMVIVTCCPGPDDEHRLIIRLTLDAAGVTDRVVVSSIGDAGAQLESWLAARAQAEADV